MKTFQRAKQTIYLMASSPVLSQITCPAHPISGGYASVFSVTPFLVTKSKIASTTTYNTCTTELPVSLSSFIFLPGTDSF